MIDIHFIFYFLQRFLYQQRRFHEEFLIDLLNLQLPEERGNHIGKDRYTKNNFDNSESSYS